MSGCGEGLIGPFKRPPDQLNPQLQHSAPGQVSNTSAWADIGALGGATKTNNRTFEQIIEEKKKNRNIIEIQLLKTEATQGYLIKRSNL